MVRWSVVTIPFWNSKIRRHKTIIDNIATYIWIIGNYLKKISSNIQALKMNYCNRFDRVRNSGVRRYMRVNIDIFKTTECKRLRWMVVCHVQGMNDESWINWIIKWTPLHREADQEEMEYRSHYLITLSSI